MSDIDESTAGAAASAGEEHNQEHEHEHADVPMPPATFEFFVMSLKMQADMAMGLLHFGKPEDRPKPDMRIARHSIDLLSMIGEKTKGNLTYEEERLLQNTLTELRFRFVQVTESNPQ